MPLHAFVDESARREYLLAAVVVEPDLAVLARKVLRGHCKPRQRRIHFTKESDARRKTILGSIGDLGLRLRIYSASGRVRDARQKCFWDLLSDAGDIGVERLVIESGDAQDRHDERTIAMARQRLPRLEGVRFVHLPPYAEPLLWVADAVAWSMNAGDRWRKLVKPMLEKSMQELGRCRN